MKHRRGSRHTPREVRRRILTIAIPLLSLGLTFTLFYVFVPRPGPSVPPAVHVPTSLTKPPKTAVAPALPERIEIAALGLVAPIYPIGLTVDGDMAINDTTDQVAWYQLGPAPGEKGSAVIAGHYGWKDGNPSIFNELHTLKPGDEVKVIKEDGGVNRFVVRQIRTYQPDDDTTEVFRSTDSGAHLNLVTCQGTWDNSRKTYTERLVVFTDLEG